MRNDRAAPEMVRPFIGKRGVSLQERIYRLLDEQLNLGAFDHGQAMPTEDALAAQFAVSRVTIRAALARLEQEGRIRRVQGRGTTAVPQHRAARLSMTDVLGDMDEVARATTVRVLAFDYRPAPPEAAMLLDMPPGTLCQYAQRLRLAHGTPRLHLTTYIPETIGRLWTQADLAGHSLQSLLRRHGFAAATGQQIVTATQAGPNVAEGLGVELGALLLRVQRSTFTIAGLPIAYIDILGPATSFDLRMTLRLGSADG